MCLNRPRTSSLFLGFRRSLLALVILLCMPSARVASSQANKPKSPSDGQFGGYSTLQPQQKRLVDDWFKRLSAALKKPVDPVEAYDQLPLSTKTTFGAVTHALLRTPLTAPDGTATGQSAIDLVAKLDGVAGEIHGASGDQQYRIYVQMEPGVMDRLQNSREFKRAMDNTVYHKGYPICFRSVGGAPSIQISLVRDATRADIDVDYRTSKFPLMLINGHLTASNSDVRAGGNDQRHNKHWSGLTNWWSNLLGLPLIDATDSSGNEKHLISDKPRLKNAKSPDAVYDFLKVWLVEGKPGDAIGYFDPEAAACMELERGDQFDPGVWKFALLRSMQVANQKIGPIRSVQEAVSRISLSNARIKTIEQPHGEFALYSIREDLAEEFRCANRLDATHISAKSQRSTSFGKYVGALFSIDLKDRKPIIASLWKREDDYWRLVSYEVDPQFDRSAVPNLVPDEPVAPSVEYAPGDKDMIKSASQFLNQWLVKGDVERALTYLAPSSFSCVNVYKSDELPKASNAEEARLLLKNGLSKVVLTLGPSRNLPSVITAAEINNPDLKVVKHAESKSFVVVSLPGSMALATDCDRRKQDGDPEFSGLRPSAYGKYYASGFRLLLGQADPGTLWLVWGKENGAWKIRSYLLLTP